MLSYDRVRELFDYEEGHLYNKTYRSPRSLEGSKAGNPRVDGYIQLCIDQKMYRLHRVIWLWHYGYLPENSLDHINNIKDDNRVENLREVSPQCNAINSNEPRNNSSGIRGIYFNPKQNRWVAQIKVNQRKVYLGQSSCKLEAACLRLAAEQCLQWETCNRSSAYKYVSSMINR